MAGGTILHAGEVADVAHCRSQEGAMPASRLEHPLILARTVLGSRGPLADICHQSNESPRHTITVGAPNARVPFCGIAAARRGVHQPRGTRRVLVLIPLTIVAGQFSYRDRRTGWRRTVFWFSGATRLGSVR